ncbi:MAG TPA: MscL family protein [Methanomicrobiales archaeon]|nr:MscL family protein [Methanomicrobiales archaeon]
MSLMSEFMDFLKEYKVVPLAIAFIMGVAATAVVTALVNDIIMGFIKPLMPTGDWKTAVLNAGPFQFAWGDFLAALINFIIIAFVIFLVAKFMFKEEKVTKK